MASSSASTFTSNVRQFAHEVREIFLDFLRWDEQDDAAAQEANLSAFDDPTSKSVQLPDGGWKMVQANANQPRFIFLLSSMILIPLLNC